MEYSLQSLSPTFLRQIFIGNLISWPVVNLPTVSPQYLDYGNVLAQLFFYVGLGDLNSVPHACLAITSILMETSDPLKVNFKLCLEYCNTITQS